MRNNNSKFPEDLRPSDDRELELLIHCARARVEPERAERIRELAGSGLDWQRLSLLAQRNGLSPLLYSHLQQVAPGLMPVEHWENLRDYFQKNSAFSLLLTGELLRLIKSLRESGIEAVPYKGPAIAAKLYGNQALRQYCDLDILIRERDVWRASELLAARGYEPHFDIPEKKRAAFVRLSYVQLFRRDAGRMLIELHWAIAPRFFGVPFDIEAMWRRLHTTTLISETIAFPCSEDLLVMLCVHGAKDCWEKLEWVGAVAELLHDEQSLDWDLVFAQARELRCRRLLELGLLLAHGLFESPLPVQVTATRHADKLTGVAKQVVERFANTSAWSPSFSERVRFHLGLKDSFTQQARHCLRLAMTTTPVDWSALSLPGPLSFAYPLLRAIRLTRKYGLNHERARGSQQPRSNHAA